MKTVFAFGYEFNVEDWVKYIAVDMDGEIFGFESKPELSRNYIWDVNPLLRSIYLDDIDQPFTENELLIVGV